MKKQFYACMAGWVMACMLLDCGSAAANPSEGVIRPTQLTCEYQQNPGVVDVAAPRLSWINEADAAIHGAAQSAWQIRVATTKELLENDQPDLWDSKRMKDNRSTLITYGGKALPSGTTCWWQVRVWDQKGKLSAWSEPACWTMGMLSPEDWKCKWIGAPWQDENSLEKSGQDTPPAAPLLRKSFQIQKEIASAHFFGTGLGYFELYLNGEKVSDDVLVPAQTNYSKRPGLQDHGIPVEDNFREYRVMYLGYDVTSLLHQGDNVVGAILGNGFFNAKIHWVMAYGSPRFFGQILVRYKDGSQEIIGSDESWKASKSAIVSDMVYAGEHYDARQEQKGWSTPGFKDAGWQPVALRQAPTGILVAQNTPTDRVMEVLPPVTIEKLSDGKYRVDFGQEISGWLHLHKVKGEAGQRIDIKYLSESPNGANSYTLRGEGEESYHTHFTWYVFRTVEITGWPGELKPEQITAEAVHTAVPTTGVFECSNPLFNTINRIWWRSLTDNLHSGIASDCPHRERSAYTGDGQVSCVTVMHNFNASAFYHKWIKDIWGAQDVQTGYVPNGAPWQPGCGGGVAWGAAMNIMPWEFYTHYGDLQMLSDNYTAMKEQLRYMQTWVDKDGIMNQQNPLNPWFNLGDWCPPYEFPATEMVHTFYLWRCADFTAQAAEVLGEEADAKLYGELRDRTAEAFHKRFYDADKGTYGRYGGNIFALKIGVPAAYRDRVIASLRQDLIDNGGHLDTGIFGTQFFFEVLAENGLNEFAYQAMNQRDYPSFGLWIEQGATTTWEQWNGENSRNHPMFGGSLTWFYRKIAGMNADPKEPGYRHIIFRPQPVSELDWARYSNLTPYGRAGIEWQKQNGEFIVKLQVPVGSTATFYMPGFKPDLSVKIKDEPAKSQNVTLKGIENGCAVYQVRSGNYTFAVKLSDLK